MPEVEVAEGLLDDEDWIESLLSDCDGLIHVAGAAGTHYPDPDHYEKINVDLTESVFRAARRAGIERAVYCGTIVIPQGLQSPYAASKRRGAEVARREAGAKLKVMVVHPAGMVGPQDRKPTPLGRGLHSLARGHLSACVGGGGAYVHVDDVAEMMVAALERGENGRDYVASAEFWRTKDLFGSLAQQLELPAPRILPDWLSRGLSGVMEAWSKLTGSRPPLSRFTVSYLMQDPCRSPDGMTSRSDLGLGPYRSVEEGCLEGIDWLMGANPS
jgi:dihydroflavonol-4-reductase